MMDKIIAGDANAAGKSVFGNKAEGLIFLVQNKFHVPRFFLLDHQTLRQVLAGELSANDLVAEWVREFSISPDSHWAVRSSADVEDGASDSFAGLFHTEVNVPVSGIGAAISKVLEGYAAVQNLAYQQVENMQFGVIIQQMLRPEYAGVIFSHNPFDAESSDTYINLVPGMGTSLVSGQENAFTVIFSDKNLVWTNEDEEFEGQVFTGELQRIVKSGRDIKRDISPYIDALIAGAKKLAQLKNHPVDVEFAIAEGQINWLQVRPITTRKNAAPVSIWDNSNIGENYPGITLPLSVSFVRHTYQRAYVSMAAFLGMSQHALIENKPLFDNMVGEIYGALYYNVTAWQQLLYQLPFGKKTSRQITKIWNMDDAVFTPPASKPSLFNYCILLFNLVAGLLFFKRHKKSFEAKYAAITSTYDKAVFNKKNHAELIADFHHIDKELAENWTVPVLNGFFAMLLFSGLKKVVLKSRLQADHPNFTNDILFSQGDVISVSIVRDFQDLVKTIRGDEALTSLFRQEKPDIIIDKIAAYSPSIHQKIMRYIELYGERCDEGELKMETSNYKDEPLRFIELLQSNTQGTMHARSSVWSFDYRAVLREKYRHNPLKRLALTLLIKMTLNRIRDRENYRFLRTKAFAMVRNLFRAMDMRLLEANKISAKRDSLYLDLKAILNIDMTDHYKSIIAENKLQYEGYRIVERANRYAQSSKGFLPVEKDRSAQAKSQLKGIGCCSGTITAKVAVITGGSLDSGGFAGRILVARYFEPGWINLFAQAAGIISEKGNLLSHTAILCREMGIPSIVGAKGIFDALNDGDTVQMNGATGEINLLDND